MIPYWIGLQIYIMRFTKHIFALVTPPAIVLKPQERKVNFDDSFALHDMSLEFI